MSTQSDYLSTTKDVYRDAALLPEEGLCCTTTPVWQLPGLTIPRKMLEMNYGCGTTVHPSDLTGSPTVLYVGIGGGMELLQFAYFSRRQRAIIGIDPVPEMIETCAQNLEEAARENEWFERDYIQLREGDALDLPVEDESISVAAQNCLFNIFKKAELQRALEEMYRVLEPRGRLVLSDPICEEPIPKRLREDDRLRALCLSGAVPLGDYLTMLAGTGFGTMEVRARRPYRILDPHHYGTDGVILVESVELCAIKDPLPADGPCVFTGKTATYFGEESQFDDGKGHTLPQNRPVAVCDKTGAALASLGREDLYISESTYHYDGGGCC